MRIAQCLRCFACAGVAAAAVVLSLAGAAGAAAWLIQVSPHPIRGSLADVSCTSSTACTAVGYYEREDTEGAIAYGPVLAERWDGARWSIEPTANPPGATDSSFDAVSCTSSTACTAVGSYEYKNASGESVRATLAEGWDGTQWSIQPTPNPPGATDSSFHSVSCTSSTACTAVGDSTGTLAERWDGTRWSIQATPRPSYPSSAGVVGTSANLYGVSCTSSTACIAVGSLESDTYEEDGFYHIVELTFAEGWNGKRWSIQPITDPPLGLRDTAVLYGVSCTSSGACIAVGDYGAEQGLAERWNGKRWSIQPTSNVRGSEGSALYAVSCTSRMSCTAVGSYLASGIDRPLVERLTPTTPAKANLTGIPAACARAAFTAHITGVGIATVGWWVDGRRLRGRRVHRTTAYAATVSLTPGRHRVTVRVRFVPSSHAVPRTFRTTVTSCQPPAIGLG